MEEATIVGARLLVIGLTCIASPILVVSFKLMIAGMRGKKAEPTWTAYLFMLMLLVLGLGLSIAGIIVGIPLPLRD